MSRIIMIAGGSRSGKSAVSEARLTECRRAAYVATLEVRDDEMRARVDAHMSRRPDNWRTVEAPHDLAGALRGIGVDEECVLVDCLTGWLTNRFLALGGIPNECEGATQGNEPQAVKAFDPAPILGELDGALAAACDCPAREVIFVTNEVGCGVVPATQAGRRFRDLQGWANQKLAAAAAEVYLVQFGIATRLK